VLQLVTLYLAASPATTAYRALYSQAAGTKNQQLYRGVASAPAAFPPCFYPC
jgi:hypothetical protein